MYRDFKYVSDMIEGIIYTLDLARTRENEAGEGVSANSWWRLNVSANDVYCSFLKWFTLFSVK